MIEQPKRIEDGYTRTSEFGFEYRPLPRRYRRKVLGRILGSDNRLFAARHELGKCVVTGEPPWDSHFDDVCDLLSGMAHEEDERRDEENLRDGVRMCLMHPEVATRSCDSCRHWWYGSDGRIARGANGQLLKRHGVVMCDTPAGCPKGHYDNQLMSDKNQAAYSHYQECVAVGDFPDDLIVRSNATIIREVEHLAYWEKMRGLLCESV